MAIAVNKVKLEHEPFAPKVSADSENAAAMPLPCDRETERRLVWKCDRHVLPAISLLYLLAFVDRVNIGNARIQGLESDLGMTGNAYNVALSVFFAPYVQRTHLVKESFTNSGA